MTTATRRSTAATIAIVAAAIAFFVSPVWGFFLGLFAVVMGLLGLLGSAASTKVKGGLLSIVATLLGAVAVVVKILEGALRLIF